MKFITLHDAWWQRYGHRYIHSWNMSEVYVHEPPTKGKVILHTTYGPLDIELWSKEAPRAVRNFVQLCMEGYYDKTIVHRVVPEFIIQTGDPTGSGTGGESVYHPEPFPNEIHSRLRFRHRGLVAVANINGDASTNGSQFFITLAQADQLNHKHTIFGKVTGETIYNLVNIGNTPCDKDDRPLEPPVITHVTVVWNPFNDLTPRPRRVSESPVDASDKPELREALKTRKTALLSFDDDTDGDELLPADTSTDATGQPPVKRGKMTSAHDILVDDPRLLASSSAASKRLETSKTETTTCPPKSAKAPHDPTKGASSGPVETQPSDSRPANLAAMKERVSQKIEEEEKELRHAILKMQKGRGSAAVEGDALASVVDSDLLSEKEKARRALRNRGKDLSKKRRSENVMNKLDQFRERLKMQRGATTVTQSQDPLSGRDVDEKLGIERVQFTALPNLDEEIDESEPTWMNSSGLKFAVDSSRAFEMDAAKDNLVVVDSLHGVSKEAAEIVEKQRRRQRLMPSLKGDRPEW